MGLKEFVVVFFVGSCWLVEVAFSVVVGVEDGWIAIILNFFVVGVCVVEDVRVVVDLVVVQANIILIHHHFLTTIIRHRVDHYVFVLVVSVIVVVSVVVIWVSVVVVEVVVIVVIVVVIIWKVFVTIIVPLFAVMVVNVRRIVVEVVGLGDKGRCLAVMLHHRFFHAEAVL